MAVKKEYRNVFKEVGYSDTEIEQRVNQTFQEIFYGEDAFFHRIDSETAYLEDTGNHDARTEGISYGMMICVQLDKKLEFDCLWNFAKRYMYMKTGINQGYFCWSVQSDGTKNSDGPAPDGEEYFAMALFFASHRWGDGEGIFNYSKEARELLYVCIHKGEDGVGRAMWDSTNYLIRFVPSMDITDPSYHLPHFYELFASWAYEEDREFWTIATQKSREYLRKVCHPETGLNPEYSTFEGEPYHEKRKDCQRRDWYYSDAYRTIANISLDFEWFEKNRESGHWNQETANHLQTFFCQTVAHHNRGVYLLDGTILPEEAMHPVAMTAVNAQASLAANGAFTNQCVTEFWDTPLRKGNRRYYDNCLYMFAMLALSGNYRIW